MKNTRKPQFSIARPQPTTAKMISKSKCCNRHGVGLRSRVIEIHAHINKCTVRSYLLLDFRKRLRKRTKRNSQQICSAIHEKIACHIFIQERVLSNFTHKLFNQFLLIKQNCFFYKKYWKFLKNNVQLANTYLLYLQSVF